MFVYSLLVKEQADVKSKPYLIFEERFVRFLRKCINQPQNTNDNNFFDTDVLCSISHNFGIDNATDICYNTFKSKYRINHQAVCAQSRQNLDLKQHKTPFNRIKRHLRQTNKLIVIYSTPP